MTIRCHMYKAIVDGQRSRRCVHYANTAIAGCDLLVGRSCIEWARSNGVSISLHPFNLEAAQANLEACSWCAERHAGGPERCEAAERKAVQAIVDIAGLTPAELGTSTCTPEQRKQGAAYALWLQRQAPLGRRPEDEAPQSIELEPEHAEKILALREIFPQGVITIKKG